MSVTEADVIDAPVNEDGRRLRRDRNRDAVVDAMLELYRDGILAPSSDEIAERAGLSPRSLFRYFDDLDDLVRAAITRQHDRVRPALQITVTVDASFQDRVRALVEQRLRLFDAISSVGVVSRLRAPFQPLIATELAQARSSLRGQIQRLFAAELAEIGSAAVGVLAAVDVICSFEGYQLMRQDQRLSRAGTAAALGEAISRLLTPEVR